MKPLVLASRSPRRTALLHAIGLPHTIDPPEAQEPPLTLPPRASDEACRHQAMALARFKACDVAPRHPDAIVIGADTIVVVDGVAFGKPHDEGEARRMLHALAGRTHRVYTGIALISATRHDAWAVATDVTFFPLDVPMQRAIDDSLCRGAWRDKAGAYGIQDVGARFVAAVSGDYANVVGLPVASVWRRLQTFACDDAH